MDVFGGKWYVHMTAVCVPSLERPAELLCTMLVEHIYWVSVSFSQGVCVCFVSVCI